MESLNFSTSQIWSWKLKFGTWTCKFKRRGTKLKHHKVAQWKIKISPPLSFAVGNGNFESKSAISKEGAQQLKYHKVTQWKIQISYWFWCCFSCSIWKIEIRKTFSFSLSESEIVILTAHLHFRVDIYELALLRKHKATKWKI